MHVDFASIHRHARTDSHMAVSTENHTQYNLAENSVTPEIFMRYRYTAQPCDIVRYRLRLDIDSTRGNLRVVSLRGVDQSTEVDISHDMTLIEQHTVRVSHEYLGCNNFWPGYYVGTYSKYIKNSNA